MGILPTEWTIRLCFTKFVFSWTGNAIDSLRDVAYNGISFMEIFPYFSLKMLRMPGKNRVQMLERGEFKIWKDQPASIEHNVNFIFYTEILW